MAPVLLKREEPAWLDANFAELIAETEDWLEECRGLLKGDSWGDHWHQDLLLDMKKRLKRRLLRRGKALVESGQLQVERARDVLDPHEDAALERLLERCVAEVPTYSWLNRASFFLEVTWEGLLHISGQASKLLRQCYPPVDGTGKAA